MAGVSDCFGIGSIVFCKTCYNKEIEGEVLAFDPQTKMLVLKSPASNGRVGLNDVHIVNLSLVSDVQVKKEATSVPEPPQSLNLQRLNTRVRNQVEEKRRLVTALNAGVSPDGQKLFLTITKTINEVTWQGANIVVLNQVTITPPYRPENVKGNCESKAYSHIKKIVEKHVKDQQLEQLKVSPTETTSATSSPQIREPIDPKLMDPRRHNESETTKFDYHFSSRSPYGISERKFIKSASKGSGEFYYDSNEQNSK